MEKKKNSVGLIALVVILVVALVGTAIFATYAWAKYTSSKSANATAEVARWDVTFTPGTSSFTGNYTHVVTGKVAPGTSGTFDVAINPGNTDVCFNYVITVDKITFLDGTGKVLADTEKLETTTATTAGIDGVTSDVTVGQLKDHIKLTYSKNGGADTAITIGTTTIAGQYDLATHKTGPATSADTYVMKWNWAYEGTGTDAQKTQYDIVDTAAGRYAASKGLQFKIDYTVVATQILPNS